MPYVFSVAGTDDALTISLAENVTFINPPVLQGTLVGAGAPNYLNAPSKIFVHKNYAYIVTTNDTGLTIVDISNLAIPATVGYINLGGICNDISGGNGTVFGDLLYIIRIADDTFQIIDVSDPINPIILSTMAGAGAPNFLDQPMGIDVVGDYAYIASRGEPGLTIINVADPTAPYYVGGLYGAGAPNFMDGTNDVIVRGNYAYISAQWADHRIKSIDISNPVMPTLVQAIWVASSNRMAFFPDGNHIFVCSTVADRLDIVDITNPAAMAVVATLNDIIDGSFDQPFDVYIEDTCAYVACSGAAATGERMSVIDITDPLVPYYRGSLSGAGPPNYMDGCRGVALKSTFPPTIQTNPATGVS